MNHKLVVANWKMNPQTYAEAERLTKSVLEYGGRDVVICPPYPFLHFFRDRISKRRYDLPQLGAQDVFYEKEGAYTGEVSVGMLKDAGVKYVIVGHSERRGPPLGGGDTDQIVAKKLRATLEGGLTPILCVGETERPKTQDKGLRKGKEFVRRQLMSAFKEVLQPTTRRLQDDNEPRLIVAYEPVWAISSRSGGVSDTPESAQQMIQYIKDVLKDTRYKIQDTKVLYGGSVNGKNAAGFLRLPECDGVLVGGASLRPKEFRKIVEASRNV